MLVARVGDPPPPSVPPDSMRPPASVRPPGGSELYAGKYRLVREIGRGGMGAVHEAIEVALDRVVAIKRMPPGGIAGNSLEARQRFRREVTAAARLTHPGIAQVLGYGTIADGEHFIAMELVQGDNLRAELKRLGTVRDVLALFDQMLAVLSYAHARGVVHSDLKPENILVTRIGAAPLCKLLDFGVARVEAPPVSGRDSAPPPPPSLAAPADEVVFGTPRYMAPEQVRGGKIGPAADLYAVGVMLFEALTGAIPIAGRGEAVMQRKLTEPPPPLATTRFGEPSGELTRLVERLLDRDPTTRLASAADARTALAACPEAEARIPFVVPPSSRPSDAPETVRVARGATGLDPTRVLPFVGRKHERVRLADTLAHVTESGDARLVLIEGPTGIGRSHLLDWFVRQVREEGGRSVLSGAYLEVGGPEGDALRTAIERHLGSWGQSRSEVLATVTRFLERGGVADGEEAGAMLELLRPDPGHDALTDAAEGRRSASFALLERTLARMARERPLVVALDDLTWGGRAAFEMLAYFLAVWRQTPARVLIAATVGTPIEDRDIKNAYRKITLHEGDQVVRLPLEPLPTAEASRLVAAVVGDRGGRHVPSIVGRAAGNPLFAIQLARLAREAGDSEATPDPTAHAGTVKRHGDGYLPASVQQLIEARIDAAVARASSPDIATHVLTEIAVLLPPVPTTLVELALAEQGISAMDAQAALDQLVEAGILHELLHQESVEAIELSHPLMVEVLRSRVTQRNLRARSAHALALKEAFYADNPERVLHELAEHAFYAGLTERARELGMAAAHQALAAGRYGDAVHLVSRLIEVERTRPSEIRTEVALLASRIADEAGDARFAEGPLSAAVSDDDVPALESALALARLYARVGRLEQAATATDRAEAIARALEARGTAPPVRLAAEAKRLRASIARREGRFADAVALLEQVLTLDPEPTLAAARLVHDNLAWARHHTGDAEGALAAARHALELAEGGIGRGWALRTLAVIGRDVIPVDERRQHLERALVVARAVGALRLAASALAHLGDLERAAGNAGVAVDCFRQVLQIGAEHVDHEDVSEALASLAMLLVDDGQIGEALRILGDRDQRRSSWEDALRIVAASVLAASGDLEGAIAEVKSIRAASQPPPGSRPQGPTGLRIEMPPSWGVATAAERLAARLAADGQADLAAWTLGLAASTWARTGSREASARVEAALAEVTGEPTEERTREDGSAPRS